MTETSSKDFLQNIHSYIYKVIIPEASEIYDTQYKGSKLEISCGSILEGGLKIYLRKNDPEIKFKKTDALGACLNICYKKKLLSPKFKRTIKKINAARTDKAHSEARGKEVTLGELREFTADFIKWFFDKVANQDIPQEIIDIIPSIKKGSPSRPEILNKQKKNEPEEKKAAPPYERVFLALKIGSHFSRVYYENIEITQSAMRGVGSSTYKDLAGIALQVLFTKEGIYLNNRSERSVIRLNNILLVKNRKRLIDSESFELFIGEVKFTGSLTKY